VNLEPVHFILSRRGVGVTFRTLAAELTARGFRTKRGGRWHASTVRAIWEGRARYAEVAVTGGPRLVAMA
jgi:hypothetical protein